MTLRDVLAWQPQVPGSYLDEDDRDLDWQERALCAQTDPEAFFVEKGGSVRPAKKICAACPVKAECLDYALENGERYGIWGGLSEQERRRIKRLRPGPVRVLCASGRHPKNGPGRCAECKREHDLERGKTRDRVAADRARRAGRAREKELAA